MSVLAQTLTARTTCPKARRTCRCCRTSRMSCSSVVTVKEISGRYLVRIFCVCLRKRSVWRAGHVAALVGMVVWTGLTRSDRINQIKKEHGAYVRAQSRKEESNSDLAILAAASLLSAGLCITSAEIVVFHI